MRGRREDNYDHEDLLVIGARLLRKSIAAANVSAIPWKELLSITSIPRFRSRMSSSTGTYPECPDEIAQRPLANS